jgi:hypothetical protein
MTMLALSTYEDSILAYKSFVVQLHLVVHVNYSDGIWLVAPYNTLFLHACHSC